ncbi:uncharacterized protein HMPREF1541_10679 [Cyphellophora europaea CBS 101466]|uniref:Malate dehydrogenase n=1 Tax=Cyphellophora europaea (strain CBS 101466) TaxID=1220924 RepID=W2S866_CYPE1|nr:uncharacterized protein HMPREF1541_10679 [Cyphellophora europaea CBS 101466]ETN44129.1 hypothetical protein HMPREF1541_10679 [Cyphellophora europaea CBS 101466]
MHSTIIAALALSLAASSLALPHTSYAPAPSPPFRLTDVLRSRQVSPPCDVSDALNNLTVPFALTTPPLPAPDASLSLASVIIGRGVQNYTCPTNSTSVPTAVGAIATLYEASCIASSNPSVFASLTTTALGLPLPADPLAAFDCGADQPLSRAGHHFFNAAKTPVFDFAEADASLGVGLMSVGAKSDAPTDKAVDVPWLMLGSVEGGSGPIRQIYRVETRGGQPPASCEGAEGAEGGVVSVQYSAEYWIFSSDE